MNHSFQIGQRVIVRAENGYDARGINEHFGEMAGHFGKVSCVHHDMVDVDILGRVGGPVSWFIEGDPLAWNFYPEELEYAD